MTIANTEARKEHNGDGTTSSFTTNPVIFFDSSTLTVKVVTTATGGNVTLVENTDYTVSGGSGAIGTIDLSAGSSPYGAPAATEYVVIVRMEPYTQTDDFVNNSASDAEVVEQRYDKLVMQIQQLLEITDRSIKLSDIETGTSANSTIPYDRNDKYLAFDSSGNFVAVDGTAAPTISSYWFTVVTATTSGASQVLLDLEPGVDIMAYDADLQAIAGLTPTDSNFIVGNGSTWVAESGDTARISLGVGSTDNVTHASVTATTTKSNFNSGDHTIIAAGATTAAGSASDGAVRVDTTLDQLRYYSGGSWKTVKIAGTEPVYIPAKAWDPAITNGAALNITNETVTSGLTYATLDFDGATNESAFFMVTMPNGWDNGTFTARPVWEVDTGTGTVTFAFAALGLADGDAIDTAFGTTVSTTNTISATNTLHNDVVSGAITPAGSPGDLETIAFKIIRDAATDSHTNDAKLLGVYLTYTSDAEDAA